jgi:ubiquinone/menaquinone biosynthesis C-methylase UbiE
MKNIDEKTVVSFGQEWTRFSQAALSDFESDQIFQQYFSIFPWTSLPDTAEGFDMGCGTGRWALHVAKKVHWLNCIDPSQALEVARENLKDQKNVAFYRETADDVKIPENSQDFGYSLGVLHHIPDSKSALRACVKLLKVGSPFLLYLYSSFDNRPFWYKYMWKISDILRQLICILPPSVKSVICDVLALIIYFPLARISWLLSKIGSNVQHIPLSDYKDRTFYSMRTDAYDRFATPLEKRFSREEILKLMEDAGLEKIQFRPKSPFWCAVGTRSR